MKLGDKVKFSKSLSRQHGNMVHYDAMSSDESKALEEDGFIILERWKEREHKEKQGIICGKRDIVTETTLEEIEEPFTGWQLVSSDGKWETVYVVACDMRGLYRVREEDLEVLEETTCNS